MRVPNAQELLAAWERGLHQPPIVRALLLLAEACPEESFDELADLPIGQRDLRLLDLRERLFGARLTATAACPECAERLEADIGVADVRFGSGASEPSANSLVVDGHCVVFRLPTSSDVLATLAAPRSERPARLLERCVIEAHDEAREAVSADALPAPVREAVSARMAEAEPQADLRLGFTCSACGHAWGAPFDIGSYLWRELDVWAQRLLRDVTCLARAFGWHEADVLSLSPTRRQIYLELCQA